ncbi:hypothetical protein [Roseimaritima ulvae]|uniref:Uncharacterized protein n=1 Tax=Roseimaritima ulvae TaxID=980254 RepID=A0A5B9QY39_9BACT|nr:hypothetical protein [Roseimaritima ulvae]QEG42932.1 hypothetical protein UC8_49740 [Roseimaritima ulvae]
MPFTIRLFAYSAVSCFVLTATAHADVDFNALLAQLPGLESESDAEAPIDPGIDAQPLAAEDDLIESADEELIEPAEEVEAPAVAADESSQPRTLGGPPAETNPLVPEASTPPPSEITPYTILEAEPVPGTGEARIDFQQMFEAQNSQPTDAVMGQGYPQQAPACGCTGPQHFCQPHRRPSLPPPMTLESMYHCEPCHRDLWAGYAAEKQAACEKWHKHIHNRCDCFKSKCQPACEPAACDETACDQSPSLFSRLFHKQPQSSCHCQYEGGSGCQCGH